jgi:hypothetical protein
MCRYFFRIIYDLEIMRAHRGGDGILFGFAPSIFPNYYIDLPMQSVYITTNRFSPEMVSVFASSVVDREFEPRLGKMDHQGISEILLKVVLTYP